jgi:hypothetical protein
VGRVFCCAVRGSGECFWRVLLCAAGFYRLRFGRFGIRRGGEREGGPLSESGWGLFRFLSARLLRLRTPSARYYMFMGGPEVAVRTGRILPFAHFLLGYTHGSLTYGDDQGGGPSFGHFTIGAGGGLDVGINRLFAVRVQADWLHIDQSYVSTNDPYLSSSNVARISTGLVVRF